MNKDSWVLSCRRNVVFDEEPIEDGQEQHGFWVFTDFEKAKKEMHRLIRLNAMSNNGLFDGNGKITEFSRYLQEQKKVRNSSEEQYGSDIFDDEEMEYAESVEAFLQKWALNPAQFRETELPFEHYFDGNIEIWGSDDMISIRGADDGPFNGINPYIYIDCIIMDNPERSYHCFFKELFDFDDDIGHYSYITLIKCAINETIDSDFTSVKLLKKIK